jgi:cytochrome P450
VGTIAWLRASVSRFVNGAEHERRRARLLEQLQQLDPDELRTAAAQRCHEALNGANRPGDRVEAMVLLARQVPMATMASRLGIADPEGAAMAVIATAAGYFPGSSPAAQKAADTATAHLIGMFGSADLTVVVARIALMVQACDGTAGLIGGALNALQDGPDAAADWSTDALLAEVVRHSSPTRVIRRVARGPIDVGGCQVSAGDAVTCDIGTANRDPAVFGRPARFEPGRPSPKPNLSFGYGLRPCPGSAQALALAAGVVDTIRQRCTFLRGAPISYEPAPALRIPQRLDVVLG